MGEGDPGLVLYGKIEIFILYLNLVTIFDGKHGVGSYSRGIARCQRRDPLPSLRDKLPDKKGFFAFLLSRTER